ncbi:TonB-dependent receptor [Arenimonas sp. GDDSR-1]|uniref:TonB-dependent receptor n=1 Tax=Arenimonas sp. GDDSR-1 TaxID=2950125 RepID=UPI00260F0CA3|nr:TonB-dependent receptor [Arenimonas sp. GDDSR-1]
MAVSKNRMPHRNPLYLSLLLAFAATGASAQDAAAPPADEAGVLDKVVVTAQGREQELKDVPIAVTVIDADVIDQLAATNLGDLDGFIPGLEMSSSSITQPRYAIRGISTGDFGVGTDSAAGVYIDGVYAARSGGAMLAFNDIERIEVLKGPQGTLFGRNTAAGAVSIITRKPGKESEGQASIRVGSDGLLGLYGLYNLPVTDSSALRVSFASNESDGWLKDDATGKMLNNESNWATKIAWRTSFGNGTVLDLSWDHEEVDQLARPVIGIVPLNPYPYPAPYPADPDTYLDPFTAPVYNDVVGNSESRVFNGVTLQLYHGFEWASMTYSAAFRGFDTVNREDEDGTNRINLYLDTANVEDNSSYYQEIKFNGVTGAVDWVAGASWYSENAKQSSYVNAYTDSIDTLYYNLIGFPLFTVLEQTLIGYGVPASVLGETWSEPMHNTGDFRAAAVFGDAIWHVNDRLNLTFGLRYTRDEKTFSWFNGPREAPGLDQTLAFLASPLAGNFLQLFYAQLDTIDPQLKYLYTSDVIFNYAAFPGVEGQKITKKKSWSDISPRLVVDYRLNDEVMLWGSYTNGYKAGGFNSVEINSQFENEDVDNLEIGMKGSWDDLGLSVNTSVFHYVYNDKQSIRLDTNNSTGVPQYLVDSSDEEALGWDLQVLWQATDGLGLMFSSQYIDQTYKKYITSDGDDLSGQPTGLPVWSFAAGGRYVWNFGDASKLELSLMHSYRDGSRCNSASQSQGTCQVSPNFTVGEDQNKTDARLQWSAPEDRWSAGVYVKNLFDNQYIGGVGGLTRDVFGTTHTTLSEPRQYGVEFRVKF